MMKIFVVSMIVLVLEQHIRVADAVTCASNPCNLDTTFNAAAGYNCYDIPSSVGNSVCTCPNNVQPVVNGPCRTSTTAPSSCTRTCVNGGVCNIVNNQQVCWCLLGFSGSFCELQSAGQSCSPSPCLAGTCFSQTIGASTNAYCQCNPGYTGITCSTCYFTCSAVGVFPDTAFCAIGRYFYCAQASGAPLVALCPDGQRFNRFTNSCDASYQCT